MPARHQHVGGDDELHAAPRAHDRRVVADAQHRVARRVREEAPDQLEFGERHDA